MSENIFKKIKRHIDQWIETEYWYRFRKISFFWFDKETGKYEEHKERARELTTSTWGGDKDILGMTLLKIDHMFYNLKHFSMQADFYFDSHNILEHGTQDDRLLMFNAIMKEYEWDPSKKNKDWQNIRYNFIIDNKIHENRFIYGYDIEDNPLYYVRRWNADGTVEHLIGHKDHLTPITGEPDIRDRVCNIVIEGVIKYVYSVNIPVTEYHKVSPWLKSYVRGNRRTLTDLLHLRHLVKKLYALDDTNDEYFNMWAKIKDSDKQYENLKRAEKQYKQDRQDLYWDVGDYIADRGDYWWD